MKNKTLFTLYAIVAALALAVMITKILQNREEDSSTKYTRGYKPYADLSPGEITEVQLKGATHETTIHIVDGKWVVKERENYPVDVSSLQSFIRKIQELTIAQAQEAGESFDPRFGMDEKSTNPEAHGTVVTLKNSKGEELTRLKVGKEISATENPDPMAMMMGGGNAALGRYVRLQADPQSVYVIGDALEEVASHPKEWLQKDFISISEITSISVSAAGKLDQVEWQVSRSDVSADFTLEGPIPPGMEPNTNSLNALKNVLSYGTFEDVVSADAAQGLKGNALSRRVILNTAEGFTYRLDLSPKEAEGTERYLMTLDVSASLQTQRKKQEGETQEAAQAAEEAFQKTLKENQEKLAREQALKGRVYEVTQYTVQALMKSRDELLQKKADPHAAAPSSGGALQGGGLSLPFPAQQ